MHHYYFYVAPDQINGDEAMLRGDDFRHCIQVLRKKSGDGVSLIDGNGNVIDAVIQEVARDNCICRIISCEIQPKALKMNLYLGFGLVKTKALEAIIRDATALGVAGIAPLRTKHSVKQNVNLDRIRKIAVESIKQSGNYHLPEIREPQPLAEWLDGIAPDTLKILGEQESKNSLNEVTANSKPVQAVAVLIGPEGGLHDDEIKLALDAGFTTVNLNPYRLRTELAAVAAVASICSLIN